MWALIQESRVVEISDIDPTGRFHPSLQWVQCEDGVECGMVYDEDGFHHYEPPADEVQARINDEARGYLASTDWYVLRQHETGEAIPEEIIAARAAARGRVVDV